MVAELDNILEISEKLDKGEIILYPTDTIWGLGCDATNVQAIKKIYKIKKRSLDLPLIILVDSIAMLKEYVPNVHPRIETLLALHKRPLTIVHPKCQNLPQELRGKFSSIGVRVAKDPFCISLIRQLGKPIVSTSANKSQEPYPRNFGEITSEIFKEVDYVVRYRQNEIEHGEPSVIARYNEEGELDFLRE